MNWEAIIKLALMGLNRGGVQRIISRFNEIVDKDDARLFLQLLASERQKRRAASVWSGLDHLEPGPSYGHVEEKTVPSAIFERIFYQGMEPVIPEVLFWMDTTNLKSPAEFTPEWLAWTQENQGYSEKVKACMTQRALQLIDLNPDWRAVLGTPLPSDWLFGNLEKRKRWLAFSIQNQPEQTIDALSVVWPKEPADHRLAFIQVVVKNPPIVAIPFLRKALDDRSVHVRRLAAKGLMRSGDANLGNAVGQTLATGLQVNANGWSWIPPRDVPEELISLINPVSRKTSKQAGKALFQILLSLVDPQYLMELGSVNQPVVLSNVHKLAGCEYVIQSALLHGRESWILSILGNFLEDDETCTSISAHDLSRLVSRVPDEPLQKLLAGAIPDRGNLSGPVQKVLELVVERTETWSGVLTEQFVRRLQTLEQLSRMDWDVQRSFETWLTWLCFRGDPFYFAEVRSSLFRSRNGWKEWDQKVDKLLKTWHFRKEMISFFRKEEKREKNG